VSVVPVTAAKAAVDEIVDPSEVTGITLFPAESNVSSRNTPPERA
jgi:hypothetical protein